MVTSDFFYVNKSQNNLVSSVMLKHSENYSQYESWTLFPPDIY